MVLLLIISPFLESLTPVLVLTNSELLSLVQNLKVKLYAKTMGKTVEQIEADIRRPKYFSPSEAVEYGIIDKVLSKQQNVIFLSGCNGSFLTVLCPWCLYSSGSLQ